MKHRLVSLTLLGIACSMADMRAEQVVISELMYHPPAGRSEFVEIYNNTSTVFDIARWQLSDAVRYEFPDFNTNNPAASFLRAFECIVVSSENPESTRRAYKIPAAVRVFGPWSGHLGHEQDRITLQDKNGVVVSTVQYSSRGHWPPAADGAGHSLVLKNPNGAVDDWRNWTASSLPGGTPGRAPRPLGQAANSTQVAPALRLNEVHFHHATVDWIEVFNAGRDPLLLQGLFIASRPDFSDKVPLAGRLGPRSCSSREVSFPVMHGEITLYLIEGTGSVLDAQRLAPSRAAPVISQLGGPPARPTPLENAASQAFPDGSGVWFTGPGHTRDRTNSPPRRSEVILNEIMFDPAVSEEAGEFIELFNRGQAEVDLSGWRLEEGVTFQFPADTWLSGGGYLVVAASAARLKAAYGGIRVLGNFKGKLRNRGELICLRDERGNLMDEIDFRAGGDWPTLSQGGGSSLELFHPNMDNRLPSAWRASEESDKGPWKTFSATNTYFELARLGAPSDYQELHLHLVGEGHVALRKIGLWKDGVNILQHATRLSTDGSSGWLAQGTHWASFMTNDELHVVADGRGDNRPNRLELDCVGIKRGQTYILRFEGRWVSGQPRLIAQSWDHSLGGSFLLEIPSNLGTPGRANSVRPGGGPARAAALRAEADPGPPPQVDHLHHHPSVPRSTNSVRVSAQVSSVTGLTSVLLFHRPDSSQRHRPWASKPMFDDGTHGDEAARDGLYTALLTEHQANGRLVQFYVQATAQNGLSTEIPRAGAMRPALYIVDDRFIPRELRTDRFVISAYDLGSIAGGEGPKYGFRHPRHSNHYYNMTFISNEEQVFYGGEIRTSGSPWTRRGDLSKGKWKLPEDRPFRGRTRFFYDNDSHYHNRIARYLLYLLGHPVSEGEWTRVLVNHGGPELCEETEPIGNEFLDRHFPDGSRGELYRIDDEWWFADDWDRTSRDADWSYKGSADSLRYRTEWMKRTRETEDDFSALIAFFRTFSAGRYTQEEMERLLDRDAMLKIAAVRGYIADWDSFTMGRGKNGYFYRRPSDGRFQLFQWDSDLAFGDVNGAFYGDRLRPWIEKPYNKRLFYYWLIELMRLTASPRMEAWFQAEEAVSQAYSPNPDFYRRFFQGRNQAARGVMGKNYERRLEIRTNNGQPLVTTNGALTLAGTAPYTIYTLAVEPASQTKLTWTNAVSWVVSGVPLRPGENDVIVRGLDHLGRPVAEAALKATRVSNLRLAP